MTKEKQKYWWIVWLRDAQTYRMIKGCRQHAATRRLAKEQAAQHWNVGTIENMTAMKDTSTGGL